MDISKIVDDHDIILDFDVTNFLIRELVLEVLSRIPDEYEEKFPSFNIYEYYYRMYKDDAGVYVHDSAVFFCAERFFKSSDNDRDVMIGTVAHEFAHVYCGHDGETGDLTEVDEADDMARGWGFESEVNVMREKLGPTTLRAEL